MVGKINAQSDLALFEKNRRRCEHALGEIFEVITDAVAIMDAEGNVLKVNKAHMRIMGESCPEPEGKKCFMVFHGTDRRIKDCPFERMLKTGKSESIEIYEPLVDRYFNIAVFQMMEDGIMWGGLHIARDISERKRTEEALGRVTRARMVLGECNRTLVHAKDESALMSEICRTIVEQGGYRLAWVGYAEQDEVKTVRPVAQAGYEEGYLDTAKITWADTERGRGPTGTAIRTGKPVIARDIHNDPNFAPWRAEANKRGYASSIALPLITNGQTLGALNIYAAEPDSFDESEVKMLMELADDLAYGIVALRTRADRKRAEEELLESEERLRSTMDSMLEGCQIISLDWRYLYVNDAVAKQGRRAKEELLGRTMMEMYPGIEKTEMFSHLRRCMEKQTSHHMENEFTFPDGTKGWFELSIQPVPEGIFILSNDITERKRAEEEIRRSYDIQTVIDSLLRLGQENFSVDEILNQAIDMIVSLPWFSFESKASVFLVEVDPEVLVLKAQNGFSGAHIKACARVPFGRCLCGRAASAQEIQFADRIDDAHETRYEGITPHGHYIVPMVSEGKTTGVINIYVKVGHLRDRKEENFLHAVGQVLAGIIERKEAEEELLKTHETLKRAFDDLKELDRMKSDIINNVSHELRTPLTIAKGMMELAREEENKEERSQLLGHGIGALMRQNEIIGNLITLAWIRRGEQKLNIEAVMLDQVIVIATKRIEPRAAEKAVTLKTKIEKGVVVKADYEALMNILYNLLDNAVKFNRKGGEISVEAKRKDGLVEVCIADTGEGIPKERISEIFQPLRQLDPSTRRRYGGTGTGLAVVKELVETMGGTVKVESELGKGSLFFFTLPEA